jgi:hypothetical protein
MRLSAEIFQQIVDALRSDRKSDRDKRLEPRVGMAGEATLVSRREDGRPVSARVRVRDVSRSGIGIIHSRRFAQGQPLIIQLQSTTGDPIWLVCVAAYSRRFETDRYSVGVRIQQVVHADEVNRLTAELGNSAPHHLLSSTDRLDVARIAKAILS